MPIPVNPGDRVVFVGNSITAQGVFAPAVQMINDQLTPRLAAGAVATRGAVASRSGITVASSVPVDPIVPIMSGVHGATVEDVAADVAARITDFLPDVVVIELGVNDVLNGADLGDFENAYASILSQLAAYNIDMPVLCLSVFTAGEQWDTGPVWNNHYDPPPSDPTFTPSIVQFDDQIVNAVNAATLTTVESLDLRAPALAYEAAHNTPAPGAGDGVLTIDGVHPNFFGQNFVSTLTVNAMTIS